jgi:hypothetical protein
MGRHGGISLSVVAHSRQRGSPMSGQRRARWRRLGGWGREGQQRSACRSEGDTGGRPERLSNARTSVAGGQCRPMALGMLRLPARTSDSKEKCRGPRHASPGEESAVREREKKGARR